LHGELSVSGTSVGVGRSEEGYWVVSLLDDQHSYDLLVTVHDEITSEFIGVFTDLDEVLLVEP
jgi:hypothetical protein